MPGPLLFLNSNEPCYITTKSKVGCQRSLRRSFVSLRTLKCFVTIVALSRCKGKYFSIILRRWVRAIYMAGKPKNQIIYLLSAIPFGNLVMRKNGPWFKGYVIFPVLLFYLAALDILCGGSFSHHIKFNSLNCFIFTKFPPGWSM